MKLKAILLLSCMCLPSLTLAETDPADVAAKEEQRKKNGQEIDKAGKKIVKDARH